MKTISRKNNNKINIKVSDYLDRNATPEDRDAHIDIADLLLRQNAAAPKPASEPLKAENSILKYFAPEHREQVQMLIGTSPEPCVLA